MIDNLVKLAEQGAAALLALCFLIALLMGGYFLFRLLPKLHGQAMNAFAGLTNAVTANTDEQRAGGVVAEQRHTEVLLKLEAIHKDFLSDADTKEHSPLRSTSAETPQAQPGEVRRPPQHRETWGVGHA